VNAPLESAAALIPLDEVRRARATVSEVALRTPLVPFHAPDLRGEVYLKLECLQPIGSFKIRGAWNAVRSLPEAPAALWTASAGNMAQGAAFAARRLGLPCTVVVPDTAPATKIAAVERLGARVVRVSFDRWWRTFEERSFPGMEGFFVHPFDDPAVMAGNGTIGLEILEDLPDADAILVPFGGGGLACGIASAVKALRPATRVYAAEVEESAPLLASLRAGSPQTIPFVKHFVDGIGGKGVFPEMFERARSLLDGSLPAPLAEIRRAVRLLAERNRIVAEGAGACPVAVALAGRVGAGKVVCVVSGGNIDAAVLAEILRE
jgi:threonine dehydratase